MCSYYQHQNLLPYHSHKSRSLLSFPLLIANSYILTRKTALSVSFHMWGADSCLFQNHMLKHQPPAVMKLILLGNRCHMSPWVHTGIGWISGSCSHESSGRRHSHRHSWRVLCKETASDSTAENNSEPGHWEEVFPSDMQSEMVLPRHLSWASDFSASYTFLCLNHSIFFCAFLEQH